jgi:hypothetical protein
MSPFRKLSILVFISILTTSAYSENPCGVMIPCSDTTNWGLGCIKMNFKDIIKGSTVIGNKECYVGNGEIVLNSVIKSAIVPLDYLFFCDYSTILLKVLEINNTKYKICTQTVEGGIWVEFDEFSAKSLQFVTYISMIEKFKNFIPYNTYEKTVRNVNVGVNLYNSCLNLRNEPNTSGEIIACLKNNLGEDPQHTTTHLQIQEVKDGWAYVIARILIYDTEKADHPDECATLVVREYQGYVKIIGKNGIPNIWYATSSY